MLLVLEPLQAMPQGALSLLGTTLEHVLDGVGGVSGVVGERLLVKVSHLILVWVTLSLSFCCEEEVEEVGIGGRWGSGNGVVGGGVDIEGVEGNQSLHGAQDVILAIVLDSAIRGKCC